MSAGFLSASSGNEAEEALADGVPNPLVPEAGLRYLNGPQFRNKRTIGGQGDVTPRYRKPEPARPDAARIQTDSRSIPAYFRYVRMAAHQEIKARDVRFFKDVRHENHVPAGGQRKVFGQVAAGRNQVHVSADRVHRRDRFQLLKYRDLSNVPGVDDRPDASQQFQYLWPDESVGVGDDADTVARSERWKIQPNRGRLEFPKGRQRCILHGMFDRVGSRTFRRS